jgi:dTDP-4-amino-4,6-dideoxygalactose transaminase
MRVSGPHAGYGADADPPADHQDSLPPIFPRTMGKNCMAYLQEVVERGLASNMIARFEQAFAEEMGVRHCIATPGCTPALAVLAAAFEFEPGDEIIVSSVTDYGTVQGLIGERYIPVFADTAPGSINISAETIERVITDRTRAVLVVHLTGLMCDMDPILELAERYHLIVYEDACQALFSDYHSRLAGTLGLAAGFSFDSEKTLGSDVGGCVITDEDDLAERIRFIGQHRGGEMRTGFGRIHTSHGYAHRMTQSTAAITLAQLENIRPQIAHRDAMARLITGKLRAIPGIKPLQIPDYQTTYSCWMVGFNIDADVFRCDTETFGRQLSEAGIPGIGTGKYYLMPAAVTYLQSRARDHIYPYSMPPASHTYEYSAESCPNAGNFLETFLRWSTFCDKYERSHCDLVAKIVASVAERNRI